MLGWQDIKQRYKRSKVGPFWLTISMGVMIATIGLVFGNLFSSPMADFLPFLQQPDRGHHGRHPCVFPAAQYSPESRGLPAGGRPQLPGQYKVVWHAVSVDT